MSYILYDILPLPIHNSFPYVVPFPVYFYSISFFGFFFFITLFSSLSHFNSGIPLLFLLSGDHFSIFLGHLPSLIYFQCCVNPICCLITLILTFKIWDALAAFFKKSVPVLKSFFFNIEAAVQISKPWLKVLSNTV